MKKQLLLTLLLVSLFTVVVGCSRLESVVRTSYVANYIEFDSYKVEPFIDRTPVLPSITGIRVYVPYGGEEHKSYNFGSYRFKGQKGNAAKYEELCENHSDKSYPPKKYRLPENMPFHNIEPAYPSRDIVSIEITSDHPYNGIPAGESLSGEVRLLGFTASPYIANGYESVYDYGTQAGLSDAFRRLYGSELKSESVQGTYPLDKKLNELNSEDFRLMGSGLFGYPKSLDVCRLVFENMPDDSSLHHITLMIKDNSGKVYTHEVEVRFGE